MERIERGKVMAVGALSLEDGAAMEARAGIATGQVVVGDLVDEAGAVSGETPNLAAGLQDLAESGQVIIGDATRADPDGVFLERLDIVAETEAFQPLSDTASHAAPPRRHEL